MKRFWPAAAVLAVLLTGTLLSGRHLDGFARSLTVLLEQAAVLAAEDRWREAEALTRQAYDTWQEHHTYLHTVMRHSDTDDILRQFRAVLQYLALEEMDQYAAANADLICQIGLLAEMEQASVVNVL